MSCEGVVCKVLERKKMVQNARGESERESVLCVYRSEKVKGDEKN